MPEPGVLARLKAACVAEPGCLARIPGSCVVGLSSRWSAMRHMTLIMLGLCHASFGAIFSDNILQGSEVTLFRCDGKYNDCFVANFLRSLISEGIWKSRSQLFKVMMNNARA